MGSSCWHADRRLCWVARGHRRLQISSRFAALFALDHVDDPAKICTELSPGPLSSRSSQPLTKLEVA